MKNDAEFILSGSVAKPAASVLDSRAMPVG